MRRKASGNGGAPATRIVDIAQRCGVSVSTVSRALQGDTRQTAETNERIVQVAKEMGYDPARSHAARHLISQRHGQRVLNDMISLWFVPSGFAQSEYMTRVLRGVIAGVADNDFEVCTCDSFQIQKRMELPVAYRKGIIDGILTLSVRQHWDVPLNLLKNEPGFGDRPIVGLVEHLPGASGVYADNSAAGEKVISHLLELGHKFIGHFEMPRELEVPTSVHALRFASYEKVLSANGMNPRDHLIELSWSFGSRVESKQRLVEEFRQHPEITAIIAHDDLQAGDVYDALKSDGYRIPEDISLISYDDTNPIMENRDNILTTVRLPLQEIGYESTRFLIKRILGEETEDRDIIIPVELIVRESTAPPRKPSR